jgi:short-subunit dehydrogenase
MKRRPIRGSVVVVTGATSGVARATALSLAARGASLALVARSQAELELVAAECRNLGGRAIAVPADIGSAADIDVVVTTTERELGPIDTWINAAATLLIGDLEDQPVDDIEQLVATNVLGSALASRAAMRRFASEGRGVLINVSSLLGVVPNPIVPTYVMSKFAIRGLTLSLDQATLRRRSPVRACLVLPGPIDTPMFQRAANHSGRAVRAIPPAFSPERVAAAVIRSVERPRRQRTTGLTGALIVIGMHVVPRVTETIVAQTAARLIFQSGGTPVTAGNLRHPIGPGATAGGWRRGTPRVRVGDAVGRWLARREPMRGSRSGAGQPSGDSVV